MKFKGNTVRRKHKTAYDISKPLLAHPLIKKKLIRKHPRLNIQVLTREEQDKEVNGMEQKKQRLTVDEKLKLLDELAGSAERFSSEGIEESIRIARREDWEENVR